MGRACLTIHIVIPASSPSSLCPPGLLFLGSTLKLTLRSLLSWDSSPSIEQFGRWHTYPSMSYFTCLRHSHVVSLTLASVCIPACRAATWIPTLTSTLSLSPQRI
jgi:hypothetical protein